MATLFNVVPKAPSRLSLEEVGLEGELSRRIGLTPLRALYRRLVYGGASARSAPLLLRLDADTLSMVACMLGSARDICALGACSRQLRTAMREAACAWESIAEAEGVIGLKQRQQLVGRSHGTGESGHGGGGSGAEWGDKKRAKNQSPSPRQKHLLAML